MKSIVLLLVVAILLAALWFAGERGLITFPCPEPRLREDVTITVVKRHGECVVVDAPPRLITKPGRTVRWKIRAQSECAHHVVIVQFDGESEKRANATDGSEITHTIAPAEKEKLFIYEILLASQPVVMARGTLACCPDWPCKAAGATAADPTFTTDTGGPVVPTTTLTPVTTIPGSPAQANTPPPQ